MEEYYHLKIQGTGETEMMPAVPYGLKVMETVGASEEEIAVVNALQFNGFSDPFSLRIAPQISALSFNVGNSSEEVGLTEEKVAEIVARSMASLKVYVVESEITEAQDRVKAIVRQASY